MYFVWTCTYTSQLSMYMNKTQYYQYLWLCLSAMEHDQHWLGRIANARLTWHIQITVRKRSTFHLILVWRYWIRCRMWVKFLEQGLIVLQVASTSIKTQDTHKTSLLFKRLATVLMFSIWACWKTHINVKNEYRRVCTCYGLSAYNVQTCTYMFVLTSGAWHKVLS